MLARKPNAPKWTALIVALRIKSPRNETQCGGDSFAEAGMGATFQTNTGSLVAVLKQ